MEIRSVPLPQAAPAAEKQNTAKTPEPAKTPGQAKTPVPEKKPVPKAQELPKRSLRPGAAIPALALCFTLLLGCMSLFGPKKTFSDAENRVLAEKPAFSIAALWNGTLQTDAEACFTDHFALRDTWLRLNGRLRRALGAKELGGVYLGKQGRQFLIPAAPDDADLQKKADAVNAFAKKHPGIACHMAIAPNAIFVQSAYLPAGATAPDQASQIGAFYGKLKNVKTADLCAALVEHAEEYVYYRTDHHWTSLGAYYAFTCVARAMGLPCEDAAYDRIEAAAGFYGTLASKTGVFRAADTVELFVRETDAAYYVLDPASGEKTGSMYETGALNEKDKYAVFFGGNAPLTVVRTTAGTGRSLAVFKDSYANAMIQFLYPYFENIVIIDPRYFYEDPGPVLRQYAVTDALFLYNADTFWTDASLADLL